MNTVDFVTLEGLPLSGNNIDWLVTPPRLICWGFELARLEEVCPDWPDTDGVYKALLEGLRELSEKKSERLREQDFVVWGGEFQLYYWIGVKDSVSAGVVRVLDRHLRSASGFGRHQYGYSESLRPVAIFRYNRGRIYEYSEDELAGKRRLDKYGARVKVTHRIAW